ncbi:MAG: hypothetical protein LQ344_000328 [Seirophora lacunosa]|nr:MAG: hypothetical protein LQ344_000328 [Seirophora lacunosa]
MGTHRWCEAGIAHGLVRNGYRVMLFGRSFHPLPPFTPPKLIPSPDLPGRGYSSAPDPEDQPQSSVFFTNIILYVLVSSPLAWIGPGAFAAVGYSLGGGILVNFASYFSNLVTSVTLLAPSGLIRPHHFGWKSRLLYSEILLPKRIIEQLVYRKLTPGKGDDRPHLDSAVEDKFPEGEKSGSLPDVERRFDIAKILDWQYRHHKGAVRSFISSIRYAPISKQHERWSKMSRAFVKGDVQSQHPPPMSQGYGGKQILIICGENDQIIVAGELKEDAALVLGGSGKLTFRTINAGHDFPITEGACVVDMMMEFWHNK